MVDTSRRVFVVLSAFRPNPQLFSRQIESLLTQTHPNIAVLVCADGPLDPVAEGIASRRGDPRLMLRAFEPRAGIHANFARGLREALALSDSDTDLFAFCDQDDIWHPEKVERQVACLADGTTSLCHTDARIVSEDGEVLAPSLFVHESRPRSATFADLMIANSVTGMSAAFRRDVAVAASAFPMSRCRHILHDHWTALVAALLGTIRLIDEPLVDYVQHAGSAMGARVRQGRRPIRHGIFGNGAYRRKCYRQYLWHRRAFVLLRQELGHVPGTAERLSALPLRMLFDCATPRYSGLVLSAAYRLRGRRREADQVWRLGRGKMMYCSRGAGGSRRDRAANLSPKALGR